MAKDSTINGTVGIEAGDGRIFAPEAFDNQIGVTIPVTFPDTARVLSAEIVAADVENGGTRATLTYRVDLAQLVPDGAPLFEAAPGVEYDDDGCPVLTLVPSAELRAALDAPAGEFTQGD